MDTGNFYHILDMKNDCHFLAFLDALLALEALILLSLEFLADDSSNEFYNFFYH